MAILEFREDRVKLLKSGFTGKEIEALYVILNSFDVVGVNWQEISDYPGAERRILPRELYIQ